MPPAYTRKYYDDTAPALIPLVTPPVLQLPGQGRATASLTNYLRNNAVFNPLDYTLLEIRTGVVNALPAFLAMHAALVLAGGGYVKVPRGTYLFGNGWEETGVDTGFLWITASNTVWDFSEATIIGCVVIGDSSAPDIQPESVRVHAGTYAPDTSSAEAIAAIAALGSRYATVSNACAIVSGKDCFFQNIRCVVGRGTRAFSMQTDNTYTDGGAIPSPIERCGVSGLTIAAAAGMGTPVDGLDITSAGAAGLIRGAIVRGVQVGPGFLRGVVASAGGTSWTIDDLTLDDISVEGAIDYGYQLYYLKDAQLGTLRSTDTGWTGFDINQASGQIGRLIARPASAMSPTSPPAGSGFSNNTNFGISINDGTAEADAEELVAETITIKQAGSGKFYLGLVATKHNLHIDRLFIHGTEANAVSGGAYSQSFRRVWLRDVGALPTFTNVKESWGDVLEYDASNLNWHTVNQYHELASEFTALGFRGGNRTNNGGITSRVRVNTTGSGVGDLILEAAAGGVGFREDQVRLDSDGGVWIAGDAAFKLGFFGTTPIAKPAAITDLATDGSETSATMSAKVNAVLDLFRDLGLLTP